MELLNVKVTNASEKQEQEYISVTLDGVEQKFWLHDYDSIYKIPGLYEKIFVDLFDGTSHELIPKLMLEQAAKQSLDISTLNVLDFGAGVGLIGQYLQQNGVTNIFGIDITESAKNATERDRPNVYKNYMVSDLIESTKKSDVFFKRANANCLICVSSLNVIPAIAFTNVFNAIKPQGIIALNIVEGAMSDEPEYDVGSNKLVKYLIDTNAISLKLSKVYQHRFSSTGKPINYMAIVANKQRTIEVDEAKCFERRIWRKEA
ncbi:MAG: class I SAM-dependent methyltransferase [Candidatus Thiodiazotropha sp.]